MANLLQYTNDGFDIDRFIFDVTEDYKGKSVTAQIAKEPE